jgi:hypothetical protein
VNWPWCLQFIFLALAFQFNSAIKTMIVFAAVPYGAVAVSVEHRDLVRREGAARVASETICGVRDGQRKYKKFDDLEACSLRLASIRLRMAGRDRNAAYFSAAAAGTTSTLRPSCTVSPGLETMVSPSLNPLRTSRRSP